MFLIINRKDAVFGPKNGRLSYVNNPQNLQWKKSVFVRSALYVWSKTTLITGSVGGSEKDPTTCKTGIFFLMQFLDTTHRKIRLIFAQCDLVNSQLFLKNLNLIITFD